MKYISNDTMERTITAETRGFSLVSDYLLDEPKRILSL